MHDTPRIVRYDPGRRDRRKRDGCGAAARVRQVGDRSAGEHRRRSARAAVTGGLLPRITTNVKELSALVARFIGALRSQLDDKPRRKQVPRSEAARAHLKNTRRSGRRYLLVAAMASGIVAAGWGVYLWAASGT